MSRTRMPTASTPHDEYVVSVRCPNPECRKRLGEFAYRPREVTGWADTVEPFDSKAEQAIQGAFEEQSYGDYSEAQRVAWAEGRQTMGRADDVDQVDPTLGVLGPRSQVSSWTTEVGPDGATSYRFECLATIVRGQFRSRCGAVRSVPLPTLTRLMRDCLSNGQHVLNLH